MTSDPVAAYYARGREAGRLFDTATAGPLEYARTTELLARFLPEGALSVLDVGGGAGAYAEWLQARGHTVRLVEPVELHVEQARARGIDAVPGDARSLPDADASRDVVLLLGPLYHLPEVDDRRRALAEARRVLRPGGLLAVAGIGRHGALLDNLLRLADFHTPALVEVLETAVRTGVFRGSTVGAFTDGYFHLPRELRAEVADAGFTAVEVLGVEGPGYLAPDIAARWADPVRREALLRAARLVESEPELLALASHLLAVATRP